MYHWTALKVHGDLKSPRLRLLDILAAFVNDFKEHSLEVGEVTLLWTRHPMCAAKMVATVLSHT